MKRCSLIGDRAFYRRLLAVMTPILIQNIITNFVSLLDNLMVGQVGTEPMSGVAIVNQLLFVFNLCIFGGLAGPGIFTAQYYGKNDREGVRDTFRAKLLIALGTALVFAAVLLAFGDKLIGLFLHEGGEALSLETLTRIATIEAIRITQRDRQNVTCAVTAVVSAIGDRIAFV